MLMQLFCQAVGALVLLSLTATLFLYVNFKRHQQSYKSILTSIAGYSSASIAMVFLFTTYFKSAEIHFYKIRENYNIQLNIFNNESFSDQEIIDMRPIYFCDYQNSLKWNSVCIGHPAQNSSSVKKPDLIYNLTFAIIKLEIV